MFANLDGLTPRVEALSRGLYMTARLGPRVVRNGSKAVRFCAPMFRERERDTKRRREGDEKKKV